MVLVPPTLTLSRTPCAGCTQYSVTAATRSPAPKANRVSVMLGTRLTMRRAGALSTTRRPRSSIRSIFTIGVRLVVLSHGRYQIAKIKCVPQHNLAQGELYFFPEYGSGKDKGVELSVLTAGI